MDTKLLISFVIDNSAAVQGEKFEKIKVSLQNCFARLKESEIKNIEIEIIIFDEFTPYVLKSFDQDDLVLDKFTLFKMPFLGKAIDLAFDNLQERVEYYNNLEVKLYKPWMFILTDAYSFDDLEDVAAKIKEEIANNKLLYMPFILSQKKIPQNINPLLATKKFMRIKDNAYDLFFNWFYEMSTKRAETPLGQSVKFDRSGFEGWAVI